MIRAGVRRLEQFRSRVRGWRLAECGAGVRIDGHVLLSYPGRIRLGRGVQLARGVALRANAPGAIAIDVGESAMIQDGAVLNASLGSIRIGARSWLGPHCVVYGNGGVRIGSDVLIAAHTCITSVGHRHALTDVPIAAQGVDVAPVRIEDDVWIGMNCTILPGAHIGRGAIVAAGAVVRGVVPPYAVVGGVPARLLRSRLAPRSGAA